MNAQPPIPPQLLAQMQNGGQPQQPAEPAPQAPTPEQALEQELEKILGGELPGAGYLFPDDPEKRQVNLVKTTPEFARAALLRAVEVCAFKAQQIYGNTPESEAAKAALAFSQAYLLLDPTVDESGVPVGAQATAQGEAQEGAHAAQGAAQQAVNAHQHGLNVALEEHKGDMQARVAAHASGAEFKRPVDQNGYVEPPRVQPNPAEEQIEAKHKSQSQELKGARGDRPLPKPRVGD